MATSQTLLSPLLFLVLFNICLNIVKYYHSADDDCIVKTSLQQEEGSDEEGSGQSRHRVKVGRIERETRQRWNRHNEALARINGDIEAQVLGCSVTNHAVSMAIASHGLAVPPVYSELVPCLSGTSQMSECSLLTEAVSLAIKEKGLRPLSPTNT